MANCWPWFKKRLCGVQLGSLASTKFFFFGSKNEPMKFGFLVVSPGNNILTLAFHERICFSTLELQFDKHKGHNKLSLLGFNVYFYNRTFISDLGKTASQLFGNASNHQLDNDSRVSPPDRPYPQLLPVYVSAAWL